MTEPARLGIVEHTPPVEGRSTALDDLRADLARETEDDLVILTVPARPNYSVRFSAKIQYEQYAAWVKQSADKRMPGGTNLLRLMSIVLASTCRGLLRNGEDVEDDGETLTFRSPRLWELVGAADAVTAVRAFYANDGHIVSSGTEVLSAAGYSGGVEEVDPTGR